MIVLRRKSCGVQNLAECKPQTLHAQFKKPRVVDSCQFHFPEMLRALSAVKGRCHEGETCDARSANDTGVPGRRFGISLQPGQIDSAVAADADLRMAAAVDTRRAWQLDIPGYSLPVMVHAD
jgi:hypothetical protein